MKKSGVTSNSFYLSILILFCLLMLIGTGSAIGSKNLECFSCGEKITGKYVVTDDIQFHKSCFTCIECGKQISGRYNLEGKDLYHPGCYKLSQGLVCDHCKKILDNKWVESNGLKYHNTCYQKEMQTRCDICNKPITGNYKKDNDGSYHTNCYNNHKLEKCVVCLEPIEGHFLSDLWENSSHSEHDGIEPSLCSSCGRIISQMSSKGGHVLGDLRITCSICSKSSVTKTEQVKQLAGKVKKTLAPVGLTIPNNIPIHLVDKNQLAKIAAEMHTDGTKGFTSSKTTSRGEKIISIKHKIYILHSLPKIEFMGVLAHEYLHAWLNEKQIELSPAETEGFCNLGVMLLNSSTLNPLAQILTLNMEKNPDPVYGDGYRKMKKLLDKLGWKSLIEKISG